MAQNALFNFDLYAIFGVSHSADIAEIKKSYRSLCMKMHPDKAGSTQENNERFAQLQGAWEILSDPGQRADYDAHWNKPKGGDWSNATTTPEGQPWTNEPPWANDEFWFSGWWKYTPTHYHEPGYEAYGMNSELADKYVEEISGYPSQMIHNISKFSQLVEFFNTYTTIRPAGYWQPYMDGVFNARMVMKTKSLEIQKELRASRRSIDYFWGPRLMEDMKRVRDEAAARMSAADAALQALYDAEKCDDGGVEQEALLQEAERNLRIWGGKWT